MAWTMVVLWWVLSTHPLQWSFQRNPCLRWINKATLIYTSREPGPPGVGTNPAHIVSSAISPGSASRELSSNNHHPRRKWLDLMAPLILASTGSSQMCLQEKKLLPWFQSPSLFSEVLKDALSFQPVVKSCWHQWVQSTLKCFAE